MTYFVIASLLTAGTAGLTLLLAAETTGEAAHDLTMWILGALLGVVTLLLAGAWHDLRQRDRDSREDRQRLFARLEDVERDLAILVDRDERQAAPRVHEQDMERRPQ